MLVTIGTLRGKGHASLNIFYILYRQIHHDVIVYIFAH